MRRGELGWVLFMCVGSCFGGDEGIVGELPVEGQSDRGVGDEFIHIGEMSFGQKNHTHSLTPCLVPTRP